MSAYLFRRGHPAKPRIHRNDGGWCCCNAQYWPVNVGVITGYGPTPAAAYDEWRNNRSFALWREERKADARLKAWGIPLDG